MNRIKELRQNAKLSQQELADLIGVNQTAVSQWERGATIPRLPQIKKLCAVFHVSEVFLLHLEDVTEKKTLTDKAVSEKAQQLQSVMDHLSDADQRRVLEFAQNLAMTMRSSESEKKNK